MPTYAVTSAAETANLKINTIATSKSVKTNRFGPGQRDYYCIHYVVNGKGFFNGNPVKAGQGFLITPNSYQHYYPDQASPWEYVWVESFDEKIEELFPYFNADKKSGIFDYKSVQDVKNIIPEIIAKSNTLVHPCVTLELFLKIFNSHTAYSEGSATVNKDLYFEYAKGYINTNINRHITVNDVTGIIGIGQPYLYKIFKEKIGISPKEYIDFTKLNRAKELLKNTNLTVSEISNSLDFTDQFTFSKFFSKKTALSPTEYRKAKQLQ